MAQLEVRTSPALVPVQYAGKMEFSLKQIGDVLGVPVASEALITGWSTDTRAIAPGDLYFALRGPNFDGNQFVEEALRKGAIGAVANVRHAGPVFTVPDTLAALQRVATWARSQWGGEVVGVTGSAGKTSTKDIIAAMLAVRMPVGKTVGNLNNHVGVPLSLLRLPGDSRVAVIEMAMNHAGEIRELCRIAGPQIGVVTNVGHAHIEALGSIEAIAAAKRELIESLPVSGTAVLNGDDPLVSRFREVHAGRTVTYGIGQGADVRAQDVQITDEGLRFSVEGVHFESPLPGRHNLLNLLAGIATAGVFGIAPRELTGAVKTFTAGTMRGERLVHNGIVIYNDCYNSNPDAARAMVDVLRDAPAKRRIAVLGEMLELGRWAESLHREVGRYVASSGIDVLVGIRGEACHLVDAAKEAGQAVDAAFFFSEAAQAGDLLRKIARPGDAILFKGSRGTHVERALERFMATPN
ncbi:MAG TPA: UDP-N-acetylmuramoyl-tripeptide--D-alanyl-D-alanine ligase [Bryobacteraceae bacterium]|nr:UDP-N-acetylmuramoyl-tripeptide--D-alanyl-D-alanine ligase [Bryobacteraceae bacterium]